MSINYYLISVKVEFRVLNIGKWSAIIISNYIRNKKGWFTDQPGKEGFIFLPVSYKSMRKNIKSVSALFSQALGCVNPYGKI